MLMIASCYSDKALMKRVEDLAHEGEVANVEFMAAFLQKDLEGCVTVLMREKRYPEVRVREEGEE